MPYDPNVLLLMRPPNVCKPEASISFGPQPAELLQAGAVLAARACAVALSAFWLACFKDSGGFNWAAYYLHRFYERMIEGLDATNHEEAFVNFSCLIS